MTKRAVSLAFLLCLAAAAAAGGPVTLTPAERQDPAAFPYRRAELTVRNDSNQTVRAAAIRWRQGGPTVLLTLTLPPQAAQTAAVDLPAISQQQAYLVRLLPGQDPQAPPLAQAEATIHWPAEWVTAEAFLAGDPHDKAGYDLASWPPATLRTVYLTAALGCVGLAAALLAGRPATRLALVLLAAAATTATLAWLLAGQELIVQRTMPDGTVLAGSPRTVRWHCENPSLHPLYTSTRQLAGESAVIRPGRGFDLLLRPGELRVFGAMGSPDQTTSP